MLQPQSTRPWYLGYSGGKDSSALIKLLFLALSEMKHPSKTVTLIYCDTGVEIPIVSAFAHKTLRGIKREAQDLDLPINIHVASPVLEDRFFVKVIGRGYATPTNKFRWCTNRLRINPVKKVLNRIPGGQGIILLGIRKGESKARDKIISKHKTSHQRFFSQSDNPNVVIYSPIVDYDVEEVWATLAYNPIPKSVDATELMRIYKQAGGECPIIREPKATPCGKGRFGCWTCTVIRRDHAVEGLVKEGCQELEPLLAYRNWLADIRSNTSFRCKKRRNGQLGLGPFTLAARQEMLDRLLEAQTNSGLNLILDEEIDCIYHLWDLDKKSRSYLSSE
jgi:DNA sulfur modification protein DndC